MVSRRKKGGKEMKCRPDNQSSRYVSRALMYKLRFIGNKIVHI